MKSTGKLCLVASALALGACTQGALQVTASGTNVTISPVGAVTVHDGATQAFTVTPNTGYTTLSAVSGNCPAGSWTGDEYTTGPIHASCSVGFSATAQPTFMVTASGSNVTISPSGAQTVVVGTGASFTVNAVTDYTRPSVSGGTCPAGTWVNGVYTTGAITADCTVTFGVASDVTVTATADSHLRISPVGTQTIIPGTTLTYTVTASGGWAAALTPGGTCPVGGWSNGVYTTGAITTSCSIAFTSIVSILQPTTWTGATVTNVPGPTDTVQVTFDEPEPLLVSQTALGPAAVSEIVRFQWDLEVSGFLKQGAVEAFSDGPEGQAVVSLVPNSDQSHGHFSGTTTLTLSAGYSFGFNAHALETVFSGTLTVTSLEAVPDVLVTASSDGNETVAPAGAVVAVDSTPVFTVLPNAGDMVSSVGGTCAPGTWNGADYQPGAVTADCTLSFAGGAGTGGLDTGIVPDAGVGTTENTQANQATAGNYFDECGPYHQDQAACLAACVDGVAFDCPDGGFTGDAGVPVLQVYIGDGPGPDIKLNTDPSFYTALDWAAELWPNLPAGTSQNLSASLAIVNTNETLAFDSPPALDAHGTLTFATTPGTFGQVTVLATTAGAPSATFTITVNTPPVATDISVLFPWKSPCVPVTFIGYDADSQDWLANSITSVPQYGFLAEFVTQSLEYQPPGGGPVIPGVSTQDMAGPEATPGENENTLCYIPFSQTWTGTDSFTYEVTDDHGGGSSATVSIGIFQVAP